MKGALFMKHNNQVELRNFTEADLPVLYEIISSKGVSMSLHWSPSFAELQDAYTNYWKNDSDEKNYIVMCNGEDTGWAKVNGFTGNELWLSMLVISENNQRKGLARQIIQEIETIARMQNFHRLGVQTTADNLTAVALYIKSGFRILHYDAGSQRYSFMKEL